MYYVDFNRIVTTFKEIEESFNKTYKPSRNFRVDLSSCLLEINVLNTETYSKLGKFTEVDDIDSLVNNLVEKITKKKIYHNTLVKYLLNNEFGYYFRFFILESEKKGTYGFHISVSCYIKANSDEITIENISKHKDSFIQFCVNGRDLSAWSEHLKELGLPEIVRNSDKICMKLQESIKLPNLNNYSF